MKKVKKAVIHFHTNEGNYRYCTKDSEKAKELHTCPYSEEISGDYETLCDCNEEDTYQCIMDI